MRRIYTSTAHFRAPYDTPNVSFAGLGAGHAAYDANRWPAGRSYWSQHFYRAPYQAGYYQSGALRGTGLGDIGLTGAGTAVLILGTIIVGVGWPALGKWLRSIDVEEARG